MDNERSKPTRRSRLILALIIAIAVFNIIAFVGFVLWMSRPAPLAAWLNDRVAEAHAKYLSSEGPDNRGPAFEQFVLELDGRRVRGGPTVTEAEMVQLLGTPDLMLRADNGSAMFAYFYNRFGQKDWVVYFAYYPGGAMDIGYNAASADPLGHADWLPYAPPGTTRPSTAPGPTTQPSSGPTTPATE